MNQTELKLIETAMRETSSKQLILVIKSSIYTYKDIKM